MVGVGDDRWLRLVQLHYLVLLGWAGPLGKEESSSLRPAWFNALAYAWEQQARKRRRDWAVGRALS